MNNNLRFREPITDIHGEFKRFHYWGWVECDIFHGPVKSGIDNKSQQYTGLTDRNSKEIYEGDIIRIDGGVGVVVWDWVQWAIASGEIGDYHTYDYFTSEIMREIEVIGNIYENPDYKGINLPV